MFSHPVPTSDEFSEQKSFFQHLSWFLGGENSLKKVVASNNTYTRFYFWIVVNLRHFMRQVSKLVDQIRLLEPSELE